MCKVLTVYCEASFLNCPLKRKYFGYIILVSSARCRILNTYKYLLHNAINKWAYLSLHVYLHNIRLFVVRYQPYCVI